MQRGNLKDYKKNENDFIFHLHEEKNFNLDEFNDYIMQYNELIQDYKNDSQKESLKSLVKNATDNLIYTISCLNFHHDSRDSFKIKNYETFILDGLYDNYWGYGNFDNYVMSKIRESITHLF